MRTMTLSQRQLYLLVIENEEISCRYRGVRKYNSMLFVGIVKNSILSIEAKKILARVFPLTKQSKTTDPFVFPIRNVH